MSDPMKDNLEILMEARKGMTTTELRHFHNCFLGALSSKVDPLVWLRAIDFAESCMPSRMEEK